MTFNKTEIRGITTVLIIIMVVFIGAKFMGDRDGAPEDAQSANEGRRTVELPSGTSTPAQNVVNAMLEGLSDRGEVTELIVQDVREGQGEAVEEGDVVSVHYVGMLTNGTQFDSSRDRGTPFVFTVGAGDVIEGWDRGLLGMKEGGSRILVIPASLAYGNNSIGAIPARSTLLFSIELLEVR